jgi:hypothetical protein
MALDLSIDRDTGVVLIGADLRLRAGDARPEARERLAALVRGKRDFGNGYAWVDLRGLAFGGYACAAGLCFFEDRLREVSWGVSLPGARLEQGWPTRDAIDEEIEFVLGVLRHQLSRGFEEGREVFPWGTVWSQFDPKGFTAGNGLRYAS